MHLTIETTHFTVKTKHLQLNICNFTVKITGLQLAVNYSHILKNYSAFDSAFVNDTFKIKHFSVKFL